MLHSYLAFLQRKLQISIFEASSSVQQQQGNALPFQADLLEDLGAARQLPGRLLREAPVQEAAQKLAAQLAAVLGSAAMRAAAAGLQGQLAGEDGAAVAAAHIRSTLRSPAALDAPQLESLRLPNGWTVSTGSLAEARFIYEEVFVQQCYLQHGITVRPSDIVVDVGANIGACSPGSHTA